VGSFWDARPLRTPPPSPRLASPEYYCSTLCKKHATKGLFIGFRAGERSEPGRSLRRGRGKVSFTGVTESVDKVDNLLAKGRRYLRAPKSPSHFLR